MKKYFTIGIILTLMLVLWSIESNAQSTGGNGWVSTNYLGWSTSHDLPFQINGTQYMTLKSTGDLNLNTSTNTFQLGGNKILWHNGNAVDIFVGVGAGNATMNGHSNTLIGNNAGSVLTSGSSNVCVGTSAGTALTGGFKSTFIGFEAGKSCTAYANNVNDTAEHPGNTAVGYRALYSNVDQVLQTAIGYKALYSYSQTAANSPQPATNTACGYKALYSTQAYGGCALGYQAGQDNTRGCSLIAIGEEAARANTYGNDNIAVGESALHNNLNFSNNVAIGVAALENQNYPSTTTCTTPPYGCVSSYNVAVGNNALFSNNPTADNTGIDNSALGDHAGYYNQSGVNNSFFGY